MLKETRAIEYTLEILRILNSNKKELECREVLSAIEVSGKIRDVSTTYFPKIMSKLAKHGLIKSSESGYELIRSIDDIKVSDVLQILDMPMDFDNTYTMCVKIQERCSEIPITSVYEF